MPIIRKRRAQAEASPSPQPTRRRRSPSHSEVSSEDGDIDETQLDDDKESRNQDQMVKKLVRLALASEYSRQPLRRADITAKVIAPHNHRLFKSIFAAAQASLHQTFGMQLTELPLRERVTVSQKRAAQRATGTSQGSSAASSKAYILTSTLPASLRTPAILPPAKIPSAAAEASYTALYTFVVSVIYLCQDKRCSEGKLERVLRKVNAESYVLGGEKTEKVLKRMEKEGYIIKLKEREAGGEESVEYVVGPRGKVEVGERGVAGVVKRVYGKRGQEVEELEKRLEKSLGKGTFSGRKDGKGEGQQEEQDREQDVVPLGVNLEGPGRTPGRHQMRASGSEEDEEIREGEVEGDEDEDGSDEE